VAKSAKLRRFLNQPVAEIVQCGEPKPPDASGFGSLFLLPSHSLGRLASP
jgi:hypothetical protein